MSKKSVFCIVSRRDQAEQIVERLKIAGFASNDILALFPDETTTRDFGHEKNTKAPEGIATGLGAGEWSGARWDGWQALGHWPFPA